MGEFSVAIAYKLIAYHHTAEADDVWKRIWILHVPKWSNKDPACYHCNVSIESIVHVHRDCPLAMDRSDFFGSVTRCIQHFLKITKLSLLISLLTDQVDP